MAPNLSETDIKLSGHWDLSSVVQQVKSLLKFHHLKSGLEKQYQIDCSNIRRVDRNGLQLLYVWMQCIHMRGIKAKLVNLPDEMLQTIKQLDLENCFSGLCANPA